MKEFETFYRNLAKENTEYQNHKFIPKQYFAKNYEIFFDQIQSYIKKNNIQKFIILTDGQHKNSAPNNFTDICQILLQTLHEKIQILDLSKFCNCNPKQIHASEKYLKILQEILSEIKKKSLENYYAYVSLGSGTITDLLKHALYLNGINSHFIVIPTALTVTAYTSAFSVVDMDGVKRTRVSKNIHSTFWIEPLLTAAPENLTKAGFGDLLARFVAHADWYLGYCLGLFENYSEIALNLMQPFSEFLRLGSPIDPSFHQEGNGKNISYSVNYLAQNIELFSQTLAMAGISMSLCGQTTPLSGYEHVISHALDFLRLNSQRELVLHGEQVSLAVLSSAMSYEWILEQEHFIEEKLRWLSEKEASSIIKKWLKKAPFFGEKETKIEESHELFLQDYLQKSELWNSKKVHFAKFNQNWPEIKKQLKKQLLSAKEIENILIKISLPTFPEATTPSTTALEYRWAQRFSPFVRSRFSLADFIFWIGEDPCALSAT